MSIFLVCTINVLVNDGGGGRSILASLRERRTFPTILGIMDGMAF